MQNTFKKMIAYTSCLSAMVILGACNDSAIETTPNPNSKDASVETLMKKSPAENKQHDQQAVISDAVQTLQKSALNGNHGYDLVASLTTEVGARLAGTEKEAQARRWAEKRMTAIGFENIKTEIFEVDGWVRGNARADIISPSQQSLYITALGGSVSTPASGIQAPIAFFKTYDALKSTPEGGLEGKIVYISGGMERTIDGAGYGPANMRRRHGASEAAKRGALAVIIRSVGTDSHRFPHTGQMNYAKGIKKIPIGAISGPDADQLDRIFALGKTNGQSKPVILNLALNTKSTGRQTSGNVMGEIIGSEHPEQIVLIGAHLDSWDLGTGAIDDGAGVGIVMGAGQVLINSGLRPKRTIRVVLFGAEEIGLKGGFAYANAHKATDLDNHVMATESDFGAGPIYGLQTGKTLGSKNIIPSFAASLAPLGIKLIDGQSTGGPDIGPLAAQGVPTARLNQNGMDYFDLHHTPDDTLDKIDPKNMAQNVAAYVTLAWQAAQTDQDFRAVSEVETKGEADK